MDAKPGRNAGRTSTHPQDAHKRTAHGIKRYFFRGEPVCQFQSYQNWPESVGIGQKLKEVTRMGIRVVRSRFELADSPILIPVPEIVIVFVVHQWPLEMGCGDRYRAQGLDHTLLEAIFSGKPVIGTRLASITGYAEMGYTFSPTVISLKKALYKVLGDEEEFWRRRVKCPDSRHTGLKLFTMMKMAAAYERLFLCIFSKIVKVIMELTQFSRC